jgi:diguanylate cyclase (GGDEF)-like protein
MLQQTDKTLQILMVEDDRVMCAVIQEMLAHTDLKLAVTTTDSGVGAVQLYKEKRFDCVLLDYELPDLNAKEILKQIGPEQCSQSPVIILTGHTWQNLATDVLSLGAIDFITKSECSPEKLQRSIIYAISRAQYQTDRNQDECSEISSKLVSAPQTVDYLSNYDTLTKLPNRDCFLSSVESAIARGSRHQLQISLLYIDIDNFKHVNDTYGHAIGDKVLISISSRIRSAVRKNDAVCRIGEDEFALCLEHSNCETGASNVAEKINQYLETPIAVGDHEFYVTCSIGIVCHTEENDHCCALLTKAQAAMFAVKKGGKNAYAYYSDEMTQRAKHRLNMEREIRKALVNNEFNLHYQPKIDIRTEKIVGAEALIRWKHPSDGVIAPIDFIPIAEDCDLILEIDDWVFNNVIRQIRRWEDADFDVPVISINVPSREFQRGNLVKKLLANLQQHQIAGKRIELEVTERLLVDNTQNNKNIFEQLKDLGAHIAIDDFGTGYSSLSYLLQFPCDVIKIDKSFIDKIPQSQENCTIVESIVMLAKKLGKTVVAEGVETKEQYQYICEIGCDQVQGFYFSEPLTAYAFRERYIKEKSLGKKISNVTPITSA